MFVRNDVPRTRGDEPGGDCLSMEQKTTLKSFDDPWLTRFTLRLTEFKQFPPHHIQVSLFDNETSEILDCERKTIDYDYDPRILFGFVQDFRDQMMAIC